MCKLGGILQEIVLRGTVLVGLLVLTTLTPVVDQLAIGRGNAAPQWTNRLQT